MTTLAHNDLTLTPGNWENLNAVVEAYDAMRERVYEAARKNQGALMGPDAWLCFALSERDLNLSVGPNGIDAWGSCYTTQTMSTEHFNFFISFEDLASA